MNNTVQIYVQESFKLSGKTTRIQQVSLEFYVPGATFITSGVKAGYKIVVIDDTGGVEDAIITAIQSEEVLEVSVQVYPQTYQTLTYTITGSFNGQQLDLFNDETISITDKIQDIRDIAKVFTEFSQSFTIPASKKNNKVFKHYYNADITNGFDARTLKKAKIEINNVPFRDGYITLEGVDLRNNSPYAYRITFYGNTVSLKDIFGDDKLSSLTSLESLNLDYDASTVQSKLTANPSSNDIIAPLITHTQRLFYDTSSGHENVPGANNNIHYDSVGHKHGVRWDNLKYAIRVHKIIQAIEDKYLTPNGFSFSNDFFTSSNAPYYNLFMWLHRKKGYVEDLSGGTGIYETQIDGWTPSNDGEFSITETTLTVDALVPSNYYDYFTLYLNRTNSTPYDIEIFKDGVSVYTDTNVTSLSYSVDGVSGDFTPGDGDYTVYIQAESGISFTNIAWDLQYSLPGDPSVGITYETSSYSSNSSFIFNISKQMPDMGILDFLTGLFKMFNLTAVAKSDGTIYIDTLDEYYVDEQSTGSPYTIDDYVDITKSSSDSALPYREVRFNYEDTDTLLAKKHTEIVGDVWAEERFDRYEYNLNNPNDTVDDNMSGDIYEVTAPFGHLKYERIFDPNGNSATTIQWGYSADDDFDESTTNYGSYIGKPVLFYPVYKALSPDSISYVTAIDNDGEFTTITEITGSINMPSNSLSFDYTTSRVNINYLLEQNEYNVDDTGTYSHPLEFTDTLFKQYYESYITQMFTKSNRIIKLRAFLPLKILLNYSLADKFIYRGRKHQINSIITNLTTGESQIELLNIVIE